MVKKWDTMILRIRKSPKTLAGPPGLAEHSELPGPARTHRIHWIPKTPSNLRDPARLPESFGTSRIYLGPLRDVM